jgi:LacI family transcriptional regulator
MNKITIKDLAKMLNISISTVSRALSDHPDISESTKIRVKEVADKFNYLPNLHARFFRKKNTKLIALIIPEFNRFFIPDLISGIQKVIDDNSFNLIIFQSRNDVHLESEIIKYCLSWVVEGVLISLADHTSDLSHLQLLNDSNVPVVILDKVIDTSDYSTVKIDDKNAAFKATMAMIENGRKNLLGVFGNENTYIARERLAGFKQALQTGGFAFTESCSITINNIQEINSIFTNLLEANTFDGVFFMTDELLVNGLNFFYERQYKIPQDLSVVCMSDGSAPNFLNPRISHIFHSGFEVGRVACDLLFEMMNAGEQVEIKSKIITTNLVDKGSI